MASYATLAQLRAYLDQLDPDAVIDTALLQPQLNRARAIIDGALGFRFLDAGASWPAASARTVHGEPGRFFKLPPYQEGSITSLVEYGDTSAITDYDEDWDFGVGVLYRHDGWDDTRYTITAVWGYGPAPDDVIEVNLELAVNLWRARSAGHFTDVVGAEGGGAVGYQKALTAQQKLILMNTRRRYVDSVL